MSGYDASKYANDKVGNFHTNSRPLTSPEKAKYHDRVASNIKAAPKQLKEAWCDSKASVKALTFLSAAKTEAPPACRQHVSQIKSPGLVSSCDLCLRMKIGTLKLFIQRWLVEPFPSDRAMQPRNNSEVFCVDRFGCKHSAGVPATHTALFLSHSSVGWMDLVCRPV